MCAITTPECPLWCGARCATQQEKWEKFPANPCEHPFFWATFNKIDLDERKVSEFLLKNSKFNLSFDEKALNDLVKTKKIILFDAYSNKTSVELWSEDFLNLLMSKCEKGSYFTTYAATGVLNRCLKRSGFKNLKRDGFLYKRQSTLAVKE